MKAMSRFVLVCCSLAAVGCDVAPTPVAPSPLVVEMAGISLTASTSTVFFGGSTVTLTARVRNSVGGGAPNIAVRFLTSSGSLSRDQAITDAVGIATADLTTDRDVRIRAQVDGLPEATLDLAAQAPFDLTLGLRATPTGTGPFFWDVLVMIAPAVGVPNVPPPSRVRVSCAGRIVTLDGFTGSQTVTCTTSSRGPHLVTAEAQTASGWTDRATLTVNVDPFLEPISVRLEVAVEPLIREPRGQIVHFYAVLMPDWRMGELYRYDFGDGTIIEINSFETNHVYTTEGTYTPTVTVRHVDGRTVTASSRPFTINF